MVLEQYCNKDDTRRTTFKRQYRAGYRGRYYDRRRDPYNDLDDP